MLDFEAAVSGLSCAAWMYRHTLLHPIQMGEKMVCQAGSDCCDPCGDRLFDHLHQDLVVAGLHDNAMKTCVVSDHILHISICDRLIVFF